MAKVQARQIPLLPPLDCEFQLGDWHVYPTLNRIQFVKTQQVQLVKQNSNLVRQLEPRLMHLLCFLAANQLQVLDREQLTSELWPTVIVNENSLTRAISELRKQLTSDNTAGSHYLQTVSKRGYRLTADVQIINAAHPKLVPFQVRRHRTGNMTLLATAASLTFATGIFLAQIPAQDPSIAPVANTTVYDRVMDMATGVGVNASLVTLDSDVASNPGTFQYTDQQLAHEKPVVSNDGTTIAFIRYDSSGSSIYLGNLDAVKPPLAVFKSKEYLYNLSWSPISPALLFAAKPLSRITAMLGEKRNEADLLMLDLETLEVIVLLDNTGSKHAPAAINEVNLT